MGGGGDTERGEGRARERGRGPRGRGGGQGGVRWEASSLSEWPHPASTHRCGLAQVGRVPLPPLPQSTHHHTLSTPLHTQPAAPCSSARGSTLGGGSPPPSHTYSTNTSPPPQPTQGPTHAWQHSSVPSTPHHHHPTHPPPTRQLDIVPVLLHLPLRHLLCILDPAGRSIRGGDKSGTRPCRQEPPWSHQSRAAGVGEATPSTG